MAVLQHFIALAGGQKMERDSVVRKLIATPFSLKNTQLGLGSAV